MNKVKKCCRLVGLAAILGMSNAAYAQCSFDPADPTAPDDTSDRSGQGNLSCLDFIGPNGPMTEVTGVVFQTNGDWDLPGSERIIVNGFVANTPDHVVEFSKGQGSHCDFSYFRKNAVSGRGLSTGGTVDTKNSIACTDGIVNVEEVILPEPDFVTTTGDGCDVTLSATTPNGDIDQNDLDIFTGSNLDGSIQAICNAGGITQNECVRACPEFINVEALQDAGFCQANTNGTIPLTDPNIIDPNNPDQRCTPCLTAAEAEAQIPGFDTGGSKLCWEYTNSVNLANNTYRPHKALRFQTTETNFFNECYETTTTINFFGREITKTITTCD